MWLINWWIKWNEQCKTSLRYRSKQSASGGGSFGLQSKIKLQWNGMKNQIFDQRLAKWNVTCLFHYRPEHSSTCMSHCCLLFSRHTKARVQTYLHLISSKKQGQHSRHMLVNLLVDYQLKERFLSRDVYTVVTKWDQLFKTQFSQSRIMANLCSDLLANKWKVFLALHNFHVF